MYTAEWPLVAFTLLLQTSVGLLIVSELASLALKPAERDLMRHREPLALVLGVVGLLFSFAHLGTPAHSPYALLNLGSSWLSREILCTGIFLGCVAALTVARRAASLRHLSGPLAILAVLTGAASVFAMSKVYAIPTVPAWNSPATVLNFAGTAVLLGSLAAGVLVALRAAGARTTEAQASVARVSGLLLAFAAVGLVAKFVEIPLGLVAGAEENARGLSAMTAVMQDGTWPFVLRLLLLAVGSALLAPAAALAARRGAARISLFASSAFLLTLAGEVIGRIEFFQMHVLFGL